MPAKLSTFYASLQQAVGIRGCPLSLRTIQYCHGVMHKALNDAVRLEILPRNVAMNATLPKVDLRENRAEEVHAWTAEELRRFLRHTRGTPRHSLWHVAAATGLRRGGYSDCDGVTSTCTAGRWPFDERYPSSNAMPG